MCGGGGRSILLMPLVDIDNRCMYMAHVWCVDSVVKYIYPWGGEVCCGFV